MKRSAVLLSLCGIAAGQGYGPDPAGVPADFLCEWRQLAYSYSNTLRPDAAALVYDALEMPKYCNGTHRPDESTLPVVFPPKVAPGAGSILYVDPTKGSDANQGTLESPLQHIQTAVDRHPGTIVLREGTYFIGSKPIEVTQMNSGVRIQNYPGEEVWLSGAVKLEDLKWAKVTALKGHNLWVADVSAEMDGVSELRVNGLRAWQARYPNADPEKDIWPTGYLVSSQRDWAQPKILPDPNTATLVNVSNPNRDFDSYFNHYSGGINGTCAVYDPPFSFFCQNTSTIGSGSGCGGCFTYNIPGGLNSLGNLSHYPSLMKDPSHAYLNAWRVAHWANWKFAIESYHANGTDEIVFGKGGFQGARGGPGSDYFISNVIEELDVVGEYFYDVDAKKLYISANTTEGTPPQGEILAVTQHSLLRVTGTSKDAAVKNVTLMGLGFRDTTATMMETHGVPSGGDWSLERMGVVFAENTESFTVEKCKFWKIGGNSVMLSKSNLHARVADSEFAWLGSTAVAAWGWTDEITDGGIHGVDGTGGDFPRYTVIERNVFREIGIWEKQSSAFFQAKTAQSVLRYNVVFNLARAGFNINDGFGGGDEIYENVLFNTCRESSDHGPINSWDRQGFLTTVRTGQPSMQMAFRQVKHNIVISNYGGSKEVDNDDGSLFWNITSNFMAYGWAQKFKCGGIYSAHNVKAFISLGGAFDAGCMVQDKTTYFPNEWHHDLMVSLTDSLKYRDCWSTPDHDYDKTQVHDNTLYVGANHTAYIVCDNKHVTVPDFLAKGNEPGTTQLESIPATSEIMMWAKSALGTFPPM